MGCHNYKHEDGKTYFIPECWGSVIHGKESCTCYEHRGRKLTDAEMIHELKKEIKELKQQIKTLKKEAAK